MSRLAMLLALACLTTAATAFLISNSRVGASFVEESVPDNSLPVDFLVDTEPVGGVANPLVIVQDLMNQWNLVPNARTVFGSASAGGPYNGDTVRQTFGVFPNGQSEVAFDPTGDIFAEFGVGPGVLGITLKSVDRGSGRILDVLVVINTSAAALNPVGISASPTELFRATTLHELGHVVGLGHTAIGMVSTSSFGFEPTDTQDVPTMYPFRVPRNPEEGGTLEEDDAVALIDNYPEDTAGLGAIAGRVVTAGGLPINQLHVRVVRVGGSEAHIGVFTDRTGRGDGTFRVPGLTPGEYRVLIEAVNGRNNIDASSVGGDGSGLGSTPFQFAADEFWSRGDTFDPALDDRAVASTVFVRASRDTSIEFVLNAAPLVRDQIVTGATFAQTDAQWADASGAFHYIDYYVFHGTAGQQINLQVTSATVTSQLRLFANDFAVPVDEHRPLGGNAQLTTTLPTTGVYTVALSARASTGNPGGTGVYNLRLQGAGGALPAAPADTPATVVRGAADAGAQDFASPLLSVALLQAAVGAPGREALVVERVTLRGSGTGDERDDVSQITLLDDRNGNGARDGGEPILATGGFTADDGSLVFDGLAWTIPAGETGRVLVLVDVEVTSVMTDALQASVGWGAWFLLALVALRRRRHWALAVVALALVPLGCGGGGGGGFNGPFNPDGAIVSFQVTLDANSIEAVTPTTDPTTPLRFPAAPIASGVLRVSN